MASNSSILNGYILDLWKSSEQKRNNFLSQMWGVSKLKGNLPSTKKNLQTNLDLASSNFEEIDNFCPFAAQKFRYISVLF